MTKDYKDPSGLPAAVLVRGDDPTLVAQAVREVVTDLVAGLDAATVVEEHTEQTWEQSGAAGIVDAISTPPFLTDRRIVVMRDAGRVAAVDAARIASAIANPVPGVVLVVAAGGGTISTVLSKAIAESGVVTDTKVGTGRARAQWLSTRLHDSPVKLSGEAAERLGEHLGEDLGRLEGLLESLASAYGRSVVISAADLEPFLGSAGGVAPWELTDAIDRGDAEGALRALERSSGGTGGVPLVVLAVLHRHYGGMLRLDGAEVGSPGEAAVLMGVKSEFVAKKALAQSRKLGGKQIARAITLLAEADLDLRGRTGLPEKAVIQVLVARLSRLRPSARAGNSRSAGAGSQSRRPVANRS